MNQSLGVMSGNVLGKRSSAESAPVFRMPRPGSGGQPKLVRPFTVKITAHRLVRLPA